MIQPGIGHQAGNLGTLQTQLKLLKARIQLWLIENWVERTFSHELTSVCLLRTIPTHCFSLFHDVVTLMFDHVPSGA
jgi:hypothetical protein